MSDGATERTAPMAAAGDDPDAELRARMHACLDRGVHLDGLLADALASLARHPDTARVLAPVLEQLAFENADRAGAVSRLAAAMEDRAAALRQVTRERRAEDWIAEAGRRIGLEEAAAQQAAEQAAARERRRDGRRRNPAIRVIEGGVTVIAAGAAAAWRVHAVHAVTTAGKVKLAQAAAVTVTAGAMAGGVAVVTTQHAPYQVTSRPPAAVTVRASVPSAAPAADVRVSRRPRRRPSPAASLTRRPPAPSSPPPSLAPSPPASQGILEVQEVAVRIDASGTGLFTFTAVEGAVNWSVSSSWRQPGPSPVRFSIEGSGPAADISGTSRDGQPVTVLVSVPSGSPSGAASIEVNQTEIPVTWGMAA